MSRTPVVTDGVVAGNTYDKYGTTNPVARRLMEGFDAGLFDLLGRTRPAASVLEVGCGEGHVTAKLAAFFAGAELLGTDFSPEIVEIARREHPELTFRVESVYDTALRADGSRWDVVLACEVFEHLEHPERAIARLADVAAKAIVVTVPREPVWRALNLARGKYWGALGNTPGHIQHWSRASFVRMLSRHVDVVEFRSPLPWTQVLCRPRKGAGR